MSISSIGPSSTAMAQQMAQRAMTAMDQDSDGSVSKAEFTTATEEMAANGAEPPPGAPSVEELYAELDADSSGGLSLQELTTAAESAGAGAGGAEVGGAPPAGGPPRGGGAAPAGGAEEASATSEEQEYEDADLNQDGTVTAAEQAIYDAMQGAGDSGELLRASESYQQAALTGEEEALTSTASVTV